MKGIWVKSFDQTEEAFISVQNIAVIVPITKNTDSKPIGSRVQFVGGWGYDLAPTPKELVESLEAIGRTGTSFEEPNA